MSYIGECHGPWSDQTRRALGVVWSAAGRVFNRIEQGSVVRPKRRERRENLRENSRRNVIGNENGKVVSRNAPIRRCWAIPRRRVGYLTHGSIVVDATDGFCPIIAGLIGRRRSCRRGDAAASPEMCLSP